jgi:phosphoribosylaminoimidazole-succinocarboxamide synthase
MDIVHIGKAKTVYRTEHPDEYILEFRDDVTAFDGRRKTSVPDKGRYNAQISARLFELLEEHEIATHYKAMVSDTRMLVKAVDIIPLEIIIRNIAAGSIVRKYPFKEGQRLMPPVLITDYKSDAYGDPMLNDDLIRALRLATEEELGTVRELALRTNLLLKEYLGKRGLLLPDFKLEFGKGRGGKILVADEISCDTCRLWLKESGQSVDKDVFRYERGDLITAYQEAAKRILH